MGIHRTAKRYIAEEYDQIAAQTGVDAANLKKFNTWNNQIFKSKHDLYDLSWIGEHEKEIVQWTKDMQSNGKHSPSSTKTQYSALAVYFREAMKTMPEGKKKKDYGVRRKKYADLADAINQEIVQEHKNQELKDNEPYLPFPEVIAIRDTLLTAWRQDPQNKEKNMKSLSFCLNTMQPPLRTETLRMKIEPKLDEKITNRDYVFKTSDGLWHYRIGKVIKKQSHNNFTIDLTKELSDIITESMDKYPRKWLLASWAKQSDGSKALPYSTWLKWVSSYNMSASAFRKSYVTHWRLVYPRVTLTQIEKLALVMRHNAATSNLYYNKVGADNMIEDIMNDKVERAERKAAIVAKPPPPLLHMPVIEKRKPGPVPKYDNYRVAYARLHRDKHNADSKADYERNKIRRRATSYVRKLNMEAGEKYRISEPSDILREKYKLQKVNGKWVSRV